MKRKASGKFVPSASDSESTTKMPCLPLDLLLFLLSFFDPISLIKTLSISKAQHAVYPSAFWDTIFHRHFVELLRRFREALEADMQRLRQRIEAGPWEGLDAIDLDPQRQSLFRFATQFPVLPPVEQSMGPVAGAIEEEANGATRKRLTLLELFKREAFRKIFVRYQLRSRLLEMSGEWENVAYHFARTSRSSCFSCGYLIMEGCLERCIRQKSMQSPRSIHAACDVLLYGTKDRRFWYYSQGEAEPADALVELAAIDDFCLWVVRGRDSKCIPVTCGVPVKDVKKLKRYHESFTTDFFKR